MIPPPELAVFLDAFHKECSEHLDGMRWLLQVLLVCSEEEDVTTILHRVIAHAHSLRGLMGLFGLCDGEQTALRVERIARELALRPTEMPTELLASVEQGYRTLCAIVAVSGRKHVSNAHFERPVQLDSQDAASICLKPHSDPGLRILIVDDSRIARRSLRAILESDGHEIREAQHGDEALAVFAFFHPDMVFLDLTLEGMSGLEILDRLLAVDPEAKVIIGTADLQPATHAAACRLGAHLVLTKPFVRDEVLAMVWVVATTTKVVQ